MTRNTIWLIGVSLCLFTQPISAETKYVTDDLKLALHAEEGSKGKLLERLQSGTKLEVLEEKGLFAKVRTPDGTIGWTKAGFLMTAKPARARLIELEEKQSALESTLEKTQEKLAKSKKLTEELRAEKIQTALELADHKEKKEDVSNRVSSLTQENIELHERLAALEGRLPSEWDIPWRWGLIGLAIAWLIGAIGGFAFFDWLSRRRHGGYRIY